MMDPLCHKQPPGVQARESNVGSVLQWWWGPQPAFIGAHIACSLMLKCRRLCCRACNAGIPLMQLFDQERH